MGPDEAVLRCLTKYAVITGRASPAEFWWFALAVAAVAAATLGLLAVSAPLAGPGLLVLALLVPPLMAVTVRRLHDVGLSGAVLLCMVPVLGQFVLLAWLARGGVPRRNRFGPVPKHEREHFLLIAR
jgi:uncharacterized membrane protein YhaH (DUF805 family)